jgi:NAD(P)-dependent dehydrogenase (short-subunit alcohol dehydrogenase family)
MTGPLAGSALVMTGAGRGIGAACTRYAARLGARVVVNDIDADVVENVVGDIVASGGTAVGHAADVSSWDDSAGLIQRCVDEFGALDGLLNNAGIVRLARPDELDEQTLRQVVEVNLLGNAFCGVHAIRVMLRQGHGSVVNVTSGSQAGWPLMSAYGASKGGVASLTYCWAMDLAGTGVRVNAVSPVGVTRLREHFAAYLGPAYQPKPGPRPEDNAPAVAYLLSARSAPLTGQVIRTDGPELSLMTHPRVLEPAVRSDGWTFDAVASAFADQLNDRAVPLGTIATSAQAPTRRYLPRRHAR